MTRRATAAWLLTLSLGLWLAATTAAAQPAPSARLTASATAAASAQPTASARAAAPMPPGHPGSDLPYEPVPDRTVANPDLPPGTLEVVILDADQQPLAQMPVALDVSRTGASEDARRKRLTGVTNALGRHTFEGLDTGDRAAYRVATQRGPADFASPPFRLSEEHGATTELHAYESVERLAEAGVVVHAILLIELERASIAVNHLLSVINVGKKAYVTSDLALPLPPGYRGFQHEQTMTGGTVVERHGHAVLMGTFPPGKQDLRFAYRLPLEGTASQTLPIPLPPRVARTRVMLGAGGGLGLQVSGFPAAKPGRPHRNRPVIETTRAVDFRGEDLAKILASAAPETLEVTLSGLPSAGWGRWAAAGLALLALVWGVLYLIAARRDRDRGKPERREDLSLARDALVDQLARLERARRDERIGPRTYERVRTALLDALCRIVAQLEAAGCRGDEVFPGWEAGPSPATGSSRSSGPTSHPPA